MIMTVIAGILVGAGLLAALGAYTSRDDAEAKMFGSIVAVVLIVFGAAILAVKSHKQVDNQEVSIPVTFGKAGTPVTAGVTWAAPWTEWHDLRARETTINFEGNSEEAKAAGTDDITMQTAGGGSFGMDARVTYQIRPDRAADVWKALGTKYEEVLIIPASRECFRDSSVNMTLIDAVTVSRPEIGKLTDECLTEKIEEPYGIDILRVELGGTVIPETVRTSINEKQAADQRLAQAAADAERARIESAARSDAARIETCGAIETDGELKPDPECKGALTEEFLELKRIENIGKADTIVVVDEQAVKDGSQVIIAPEGTNN